MRRIFLAGLLLAVGSAAAYAQDQQSTPSDAPQPLGSQSSGQATDNTLGFKLAPGVRGTANIGLETVYNSNFYLQQENPRGAFGYLLSPYIGLIGDDGTLRYKIGAGLEQATFTNVDIGPDNYLDKAVNASSSWQPLARHYFEGDLSSKDGHDPFGSFRTENNLPLNEGLDKWIENKASLTYRYGSASARINLESEVSADTRRYQTNREYTQYLDYRILGARETAFYNVSSKTALLAEVVHFQQVYYATAPGYSTNDGQENHIRVGVRWLATAHTSGDIRIGQYRRDGVVPTQQPVRALDWSATLNWSPLVYSHFTLQTGNQSQVSYLANVSYIENRFATLSWVHEWSSVLQTHASATYLDSEFMTTPRQDHIHTYAFEADYNASLRWQLIGGAAYSNRVSNEALLGFNVSNIYLGVRYSH